jgi:hypothetical protein
MFQKHPMSDVIQKGFQPLAKFCCKSGEKRKNKVLLPFVKKLWLLNDRHRMFQKHPMSDVIQKHSISEKQRVQSSCYPNQRAIFPCGYSSKIPFALP